MKLLFNILCMFIGFVCISCSSVKDETYVPSIVSLKSSETLVMKLRSCHNGCVKGTVSFKNGKAFIGSRSLELTTQEITDLDDYFLQGVDDEWLCSLDIRISFKHKIGLRSLNSKDVQIYPCEFFAETISPERLVYHLNETPREIPFWRLSAEEQSKALSLIGPSKN